MKYSSNLGYLKRIGPIRNSLKRICPDIVLEKGATPSLVKKGIFVTGIHRSGTSWIGNIISQASKIMYWREPFNPDTVSIMPQQYFFIPKFSNNLFFETFTDKLFKGLHVGSVFDYTVPRQWFNGIHHRHLIKDPTAAFLLEWLTQKYSLDVVIVIRHPAGFVSSLLKLGWDFDFNLFLNQKELMQNYLNPFCELINCHNRKGITVEKAAVLWGLVYYVLLQMSKKDNYYWVRYEDICSNPLKEFQSLFNAMDLGWNEIVEKQLLKSISAKETFKSNITADLSRDTKKMATIWKERLSKEEIKTISRVVETFNIGFYG